MFRRKFGFMGPFIIALIIHVYVDNMQIVAVHLNNVYRMQGYSKTSMVNLCIKKQNYINIAEILEGEGQGINHM